MTSPENYPEVLAGRFREVMGLSAKTPEALREYFQSGDSLARQCRRLFDLLVALREGDRPMSDALLDQAVGEWHLLTPAERTLWVELYEGESGEKIGSALARGRSRLRGRLADLADEDLEALVDCVEFAVPRLRDAAHDYDPDDEAALARYERASALRSKLSMP